MDERDSNVLLTSREGCCSEPRCDATCAGEVNVNVRGMQREGCRRRDGGTDDLSRFDLPNTASNGDAVVGGGDSCEWQVCIVRDIVLVYLADSAVFVRANQVFRKGSAATAPMRCRKKRLYVGLFIKSTQICMQYVFNVPLRR